MCECQVVEPTSQTLEIPCLSGSKGHTAQQTSSILKVDTKKVNVRRQCLSDVPDLGIHTNTYYRITIRYVKMPQINVLWCRRKGDVSPCL